MSLWVWGEDSDDEREKEKVEKKKEKEKKKKKDISLVYNEVRVRVHREAYAPTLHRPETNFPPLRTVNAMTIAKHTLVQRAYRVSMSMHDATC